MIKRFLLVVPLIACGILLSYAEKPHALFVVGTHHYSPQKSMPMLASEIERLGFKTTVINPDWDPEKDDVGVDGVPNTGDFGEGDGMPTAGDQFVIRQPGEPNFEWTDLDEADMVGLTGFSSPPFSGTTIADDQRVFDDFLQPGVFDSANATQSGDYVFIYSSGPISLPAGESRRFSIALLIGEDYDDLTLNATTSQDIYDCLLYTSPSPRDRG